MTTQSRRDAKRLKGIKDGQHVRAVVVDHAWCWPMWGVILLRHSGSPTVTRVGKCHDYYRAKARAAALNALIEQRKAK